MLVLAFSTALALASPAPSALAPPPRTEALFSRAERRRIASYLRLRLLELHRDDLDGVAAALRRRLATEGRRESAPMLGP